MVFALIGVLALSAGTANAASVTATFTGVENEEAVHLRYGAQNLYVWAGLYKFEKLSISPDSTENPAYYMDDVFGGYCIDIDQRISFSQTVTWVLKPLEEAPVNLLHSPMGADKATLLRRLWGSYFARPAAGQAFGIRGATFFDPAPEPATMGLLAVGFGAVAVGRRLRHRTSPQA